MVQSLLERSTILDGNIENAKQLVEWVEDHKFGWKLCYRASVDGWIALNFHRKCDDVGPTVTLVKCGTNVFGGYTDQNWKDTDTSGKVSVLVCVSTFFKLALTRFNAKFLIHCPMQLLYDLSGLKLIQIFDPITTCISKGL